jgi:hypothetical protein
MQNSDVKKRRVKVFVSYSHYDRYWLDRLKLHLAILERRKLVHVWSDTRIGVGAEWQKEIENALSESLAAVLLVSPGFLASGFIWNDEMPRILAHSDDGMYVLPLIARPCAWRVAPELAGLQARPLDERALSLGTDAEVDRDLAEFTYELAGRIEQLSGATASDETDRIREERCATLVRDSSQSSAAQSVGERRSALEASETPLRPGQSWTGLYEATKLKLKLRLVIQKIHGADFHGMMEYLDDGNATEVKGHASDAREVLADSFLTDVRFPPLTAVRIIFRETGGGSRDPNLSGEYHAKASDRLMLGVWITKGQVLGRFKLQLDERSS